jgi:signal transduction histidine kinase/DNA-binding response OmpR family regulator/CHASE3 domain sensor protein
MELLIPGPARSKNLWLLALLCGTLSIIAINSWLLHLSFRKVSDQEEWVRHTYEVIDQLNLTLSETRAAESHILAYLQNKDPDLLKAFHSSDEAALSHFQSAQALTMDNGVQQTYSERLLNELHERDLKFTTILKEIESRDHSSPSLTSTLGREESLHKLRGFIDDMESVEIRLLELRSKTSNWGKVLFFWVLVVTTLVSLFAILFAFRLLRRIQIQNQLEMERRLEEATEIETIAQVASLLAGDVDVEKAGSDVLSFLSSHFGVIASKLYVGGQGEFRELSKRSAHDTETSNPAPLPGLVKDALGRKKIWEVTEIPQNYWRIESGLGQALPKNLIFLPLLFQGRIVGVIEMASLAAVPKKVTAMLEKIAEAVAIGLSAAISRRELQLLLEKTQQQSEELQAQQEELKVNNEELEEQSNALSESQTRLELQQQELEQTNQRLEEQALSLEDQKRDLEKKSLELETASRYKSEFLANMSHELRTPLNSSLILAKLLADNPTGNLTQQQTQYAETIRSSGMDLLDLINDILDLSKVEAGKLEILPERVAVPSVIESIERMFSPLAQNRGLEFVCKLSTNAPPYIETDRQRLEQILRNLLSNAIKFTEKGKVSVLVEERQGDAVFSVTDSGIGIPKQQQKLIFEAFHQVDGASNRKFGGTGLGLSISKELAAVLGGSIELSSDLGKGSTFRLILPLEHHFEGAKPRMTPAPEQSFSESLIPESKSNAPIMPVMNDDRSRLDPRKKLLLVIEDDFAFARILYGFAQDSGFQCILASTATDGVQAAQHFLPSGILLDVVLPDRTGISVLDQLKRSPRTRHIPVHVISAQDQPQALFERGAIGFLKKPVERSQVLEAFNKIESKLEHSIKHILIVEDHASQRESIIALLGAPDTKTTAVSTGGEALKELSSQQFDCVVIDLSLPDMTGFELIAQMSAGSHAPFPPVIVYTGRDLSRDEEHELRRYSRSIIVKGAKSPERLLDEVSLFLHRLDSSLPVEKQKILQDIRNRDDVLKGKTILLVDDDARNIFAMMGILESQGLKVILGRNGKEALAKLASEPAIELVLMDIMMPEMDGYEAIREIRKQPKFAKLPVIAVTAKAMASDYSRCLDAGANDYLPKPVDTDKLVSLIRVWIERA